jgi:predicted transcriptional regulator
MRGLPKKRISKNSKTPRNAFRVPILEALIELGGKGKVSEILEKVEMKMRFELKPIDYERLNSGAIRWVNTAQWERYLMIQEGLLKTDSPRGIWEITEKGKQFLEQIKRLSSDNNSITDHYNKPK